MGARSYRRRKIAIQDCPLNPCITLIRVATIRPLAAWSALIFAACSSERSAPLRPLPAESELPLEIGQQCRCLEDGACVMLEQRAGRLEVRKLSCRWSEPNRVALCNFEERFVAFYYDPPNKMPFEVPEAWRPRTLRAKAMADGDWCAEE